MLNVIHLSATGVAEIDEFTCFKGCPHTFAYIVYVEAGCPIEIPRNNFIFDKKFKCVSLSLTRWD